MTFLVIGGIWGLRVRPFVDAVSSQFATILYATIGVSCYLLLVVELPLVDGDRQVLTNPVNSRVSVVDGV